MRGALTALVGLSLLGCAGGPFTPPDQTAVLDEIRRYYDAVATEEGGRCPRPVMGGVLRYQLLRQDADGVEVRIRYAYSDPTSTFRGQCRSSGTRTFELAQRADGYEVVKMSGAGSDGIRVERMLTPHW